jgi:hypothetical protein
VGAGATGTETRDGTGGLSRKNLNLQTQGSSVSATGQKIEKRSLAEKTTHPFCVGIT